MSKISFAVVFGLLVLGYKKGNLVIAYKAFCPCYDVYSFILSLTGKVCFGGLLVRIKQMFSSPFSFPLAVSQKNYKRWISDPLCLKDPEGKNFSLFCVAFCLRIVLKICCFTKQKVV